MYITTNQIWKKSKCKSKRDFFFRFESNGMEWAFLKDPEMIETIVFVKNRHTPNE